MTTKNNLKIFLSFLSLVAFISCSAGDKLGSEVQDSQNQGSQTIEVSDGNLKTNLPIWGSSEFKVKIPEIWWGTYNLAFSDVDNVHNTVVVTSDTVTWYRNYSISDYMGNNKWRLNNEFDHYIEFTRNEKGQRTLKSDERGRGDKERFIMIYVHSEDAYK